VTSRRDILSGLALGLGGGLAISAVAVIYTGSVDGLAQLARGLLRPLREPHMVDVYLNPILWVMFAAIPLLEYFFPTKAGQPIVSVGLLQDALYFVVSTVFRIAALSFYVALLKALYERHLDFLTLPSLAAQPFAARATLMILFTDLVAWLHHYVRHRVNTLWQFHAVHHSQRQMNLFTDVRVHPVDRMVAQTIQLIPLMMLEPSLPTLVTYTLFHQWYTKLYHANIRSNFGLLRYFLVTPQSHRIHHSYDPRHFNKNFGVIFSVWDRLFGTQYPRDDEYPDTGVPDPAFPYEAERRISRLLVSTVAQLIYPFRVVFGSTSTR
jgi:sterol desaturase/sphingolipid hydroxylase (fatty acid hydroxylase superfamily)